MKHTPGPLTYQIDSYDGTNWLVAIVAFGTQEDGESVTGYITTDHVPASRLKFGEPEADLQLWTAAPAMYEALERIANQGNSWINSKRVNPPWWNLVDVANAFFASHKGES